MFVWKPETYHAVRALFATGKSDYEIARIAGVPRSTVQKWRHKADSYSRPPVADPDAWQATDAPQAYCYLLGLYLGDGNVHGEDRTPILRFTMDGKYPSLIDEAVAALEDVFHPRSIGRYVRGGGAWVVLQICNRAVLKAFPQHGPGPKHARRIELAGWQRELAREHPGALVRGLIHSDGSRSINRFKTKLPSGRVAEYAYPRYFFTNVSADIRGIFCEHVELLGVRWSQSNRRNISVANKNSVAILDQVVGPKR
jgi:hypothetical protein